MPTPGDIASGRRRDETLSANLSRIEKARASGNRRLTALIDGMEATMTARLGQAGYEQYLSSAPLETLLKRYSATPDGKKAQADAAKSARPTAAGQAPAPRPNDATAVAVPASDGDDDDESRDFRYSSDAEAALLDERRSASPGRRREIDAELDAIHASRKAHLDAGETFDEFDAEEALARHKAASRHGSPGAEGMPAGPVTAPDLPKPPTAFTPQGQSSPLEDDDDDDPVAVAGGGSPSQAPSPSSGTPTQSGSSTTTPDLAGSDDHADDGADGVGNDMHDTHGITDGHGAPDVHDDHDTHDSSDAAEGRSHTSSSGGADGNISASGVPTEAAEAPDISSAASPWDLASEDDDVSRGSLSDGEPDDGAGRGGLNGGSDQSSSAPLNGPDPAEEAQKEQQKEKERKRRKVVMKMILHWLARLSPFIGVILVVALLASCVDQFLDYANPFNELFGGGGDSSSSTMSVNAESDTSNASYAGGSNPTASGAGGASSSSTITRKHRRNGNNTLPSVYVDPALNDLFREDAEEEDEDDAVMDYPYVATFFGSDNDWTDTLYVSDDCVNFTAIGTVPNHQRDPCIMLRNGRYWVVTCLSEEDGNVWLMVSSSRDLKEWVGPTRAGPFKLDRLPYCNGYGTSARFDTVAPEWFLDEDNTPYVIFSCGHWGACHGHNWDDWMEAYMLEVDTLECKEDQNILTAKGQPHWMDVNRNYDDRIDTTINLVDGTYWLTIKRHGLNMELWRNSTCSPSGWTRVKDCFLYGYEAPCVRQDHNGLWHLWGDGCPDVRPFGTKMWTASSIDGEWEPAEVHFYREDGSEVPVVRHGTVLPVVGAKGKSGGRQSDGSLSAKQKAVIAACGEVPSPGRNLCAQWVRDVFRKANVGVSFSGHAYQWYYACCKSGAPNYGGTVKTDPSYSTLKPGMVVAVPSSSSVSGEGQTYGHIGIYVGNGKVMHSTGTIETCSLQQWVNWYGKYSAVGWGYPPGMM